MAARLGSLEGESECMRNTSLPLVHSSGDILACFCQPNVQLLAVFVVWNVLWPSRHLILYTSGHCENSQREVPAVHEDTHTGMSLQVNIRPSHVGTATKTRR
jgi:hypothetical protein